MGQEGQTLANCSPRALNDPGQLSQRLWGFLWLVLTAEDSLSEIGHHFLEGMTVLVDLDQTFLDLPLDGELEVSVAVFPEDTREATGSFTELP